MKSRTTKTFWKLFDSLPVEAQRQGGRAYVLWRRDPWHQSLHLICIAERDGVWSVRVGDAVTWFWIGSHADYDRLTG